MAHGWPCGRADVAGGRADEWVRPVGVQTRACVGHTAYVAYGVRLRYYFWHCVARDANFIKKNTHNRDNYAKNSLVECVHSSYCFF